MENTSIHGLRGYLKTDPVVLRLLSTYSATQKAQKADGQAIIGALMIITSLVWLLNLVLYLYLV